MTECVALLTADIHHPRWPDIAALRRRVFIEEQHVAEHEEWDEADASAIHITALHESDGNTQLIGCARLLDEGQIGRMAVRLPWRGRGVGGALLLYTLGVARRQGMPSVFLNAQTHAIGFYQRFGFVTTSDEFLDAGIAHKRMERRLL